MQQSSDMLTSPEGNSHAPGAALVRRSVTNQDFSLPHLLHERHSIFFRGADPQQKEIRLAGPMLNSAPLQRAFQPRAALENFRYIGLNIFLIREASRQTSESPRVHVVRRTGAAPCPNLVCIPDQHAEPEASHSIGFR